MSETNNNLNSSEGNPFEKKLLFILYGLIIAAIPYLIRLLIWLVKTDKDHISFYKSELDLFLFCLGVFIALVAELKHDPPYGKEVFLVVGFLIMLALGVLILFSLLNEFEILSAEHWHLSCLENCEKEDERLVDRMTELKDTKFYLFILGILGAIGFLLASYKLVISKK